MSFTTDVNYLVISDVHLGSRRNTTKEIIGNLDAFLDDYSPSSKFVSLDIIFIAGDLFDSQLNFSSNDVDYIILWLERLYRFCDTHRIKLRILEGTPSHDRGQSKILDTVHTVMKLGIDFRYMKTICIEYMEDLDLRVLYIPDEATGSADATLKQVKLLLAEEGLTRVDVAIMHGMFGYQLGNIPNKSQCHSEVEYLEIVESFINIGHVHTFSVYERILAEGSFDRLSHGQEEAKGGILCTIAATGRNTFQFIENKNAKIFKTIKLNKNDLDKSLAYIDKQVKGIKEGSYIRIMAKKNHPVYQAFQELQLLYPYLNMEKSSEEDHDQESQLINSAVQLSTEYIPISISKENVVGLLTDEIRKKTLLTARQQELLADILEKTR